MASGRLTVLGAFIIAMALLVLAYEDLMLFLGATGGLPSGVRDSPYVMIAVPLLISVTLVVVLLGAALWSSDTLR